MYLVVYGLCNAGLIFYFGSALNYLAYRGLFIPTLGIGFISATLSSLMNNIPTVLVGALSIEDSTATLFIKEAVVYASVIGSDLGPKFTLIGSLVTLLWLHALQQKGLKILWGYYFKLTFLVHFIGLSALELVLS